MSKPSLKLPASLEEEAALWASRQGVSVSLDQFVVRAVAEKIGELKHGLDDPRFPRIAYRRGAAGHPVPVLRGTGIRVESIVISARSWNQSPAAIAEEYDLSLEQVEEALAFYASHRLELDELLMEERQLDRAHA